MRIALVVHGFPPCERTGVENHVEALARALARAGEEVLVIAPRRAPRLAHLAERREERDGYRIHWLALNETPRSAAEHLDPPGVARAIGRILAREAPDVAHVHHLAKLGLGVVDELARLGIPAVWTAHDYFAVCHRITMLRPDLARCTTVGDADLCARCDLAVAHLNGVADLGDWQMGVFPAELAPGEAAELARRLATPAPDDAREARAALDRRRSEAFARFELVLAPSALVAERLVAGGVDEARVVHCANAVEVAPLARRAPSEPDAPPTIGFVAGVSKHKGLHVLLEAFRGLAGRARLAIHGDSSDRRYVERMQRLARDVGAQWHGPFDARELPRVLGSLDVLCLPSLWDENAPLSIREAFAAGVPVLASRVGALPESVRDGVDGLLVAPGDVAAWRAALERVVQDGALRARLAAGVRPPRDVADLARELRGRYAELATRAPAVQLPAHLAPFAARRAALASEDFEALVDRVAGGLARLRARLAPGSASADLPAPAELARVRHLRDLARDRVAEAEWLRTRADELEAARGEERRAVEALRAENAWLAARLESLGAENRWLADLRAQLEGENRWLAGARDAIAAESRWRGEAQEQLAAEARWRRETAEHLAVERDWLAGVVAAREAELAHLGTERAGLEREAAEQRAALAGLHAELEQLARHERWLRSEALVLARATGAEVAATEPAVLAGALAAARARLARLDEELAWRRGEMRAARADGGAIFRALRERSALGRRMAGWDREAAP